MSHNEQLEQPLWDLIYELLSPEEEAALLQRITSEPALARAYAKVKIQSELFAMAAKCDDTRGRVKPPGEDVEDQNDALTADVVTADEPRLVEPRSRSYTFRAANWIVAAAAMGLVVMAAISLTQLRSPAPRVIARAEPSPVAATQLSSIRTVVTTPAVWNEETTNFISVRTTSLDGTPTATPFALKLFDADGEVQLQEFYTTDETGAAQVELSGARAERAARMEVAARDDVSPPLTTAANWVRSGHLTHLTTNLPTYQPGDTVLYRSLSLSRFDQRVDGEVSVEFDVLDELGTPIPSANRVITSERGVGNGEFAIPPDTANGKLTVLARSPDGEFPEQRREVQVRKIEVTKWHKELKLDRNSYEPGDEVKGRLSVTSHDGQPAVGKKLAIAAFVDQKPLSLEESTAVTDADGNFDVKFFLPSITREDAVLTINVEDDQRQEQLAKAIPIHTGLVDVRFFAEGGELAAGLRNQVYFQARDLQGRPIHLEGRIVDESGEELAQAVTVHEGRGRFGLATQADAAYRLIVDKPAGAMQVLPLPAVSKNAVVVLHTGGKVFDPVAAIDITLRVRDPNRSLVLAAACRGGLVGLQAIERSDFAVDADGSSQCQRQLKLATEASGVIRVTVYDSGSLPPVPVAERLVYRRPARRLHVQVDPIDSPQPGKQIALGLQTTDEQGQPTPATLGVSVVNQALLNYANDRSPNLETYVLSTSEIRGADDLEDANFFLGSSDEAADAMDLLLGTQGWRRFEEAELDQLAQHEEEESLFAKADTRQDAGYSYFEFADQFADQLVPVVLDNRDAIENERTMQAPVATSGVSSSTLPSSTVSSPTVPSQWIHSRESLLQRWGTALLVGGLLVLIAVVGLAIARSLGQRRVWVPSVVMAGIAVVLGVFWMGSQVSPLGDIAYSPVSLDIKPTESAIEENDAIADATDDAVAAVVERQQQADFANESGGVGDAYGVNTSGQPETKDLDASGNKRFLQPADGMQRSQGGFGGGGGGIAADAGSTEADKDRQSGRDGALSQRAAKDPMQVRQRQTIQRTETPASELVNKFEAPKQTVPPPAAAAPAPPQPSSAALATENKKRQSKIASATARPLGAQPLGAQQTRREQAEKQAATGMRFRRVYADTSWRDSNGQSAKSTLFWQPLVITDARGRATVSFQLPSANATYILRADAHGDGRIGSGKAMIDARQP